MIQLNINKPKKGKQMFEIKKGNSVPPLPVRDLLYSKCSKMVPGDYAIVDFKTLDDCKKQQKIARMAVVRNGYNLTTRINKDKTTLEIWCIEKPDPFFGDI